MNYDTFPYHGPFNEQTIWMRDMIEQSHSAFELNLIKLNIAKFVLSHYDQAALNTVAHNRFTYPQSTIDDGMQQESA